MMKEKNSRENMTTKENKKSMITVMKMGKTVKKKI